MPSYRGRSDPLRLVTKRHGLSAPGCARVRAVEKDAHRPWAASIASIVHAHLQPPEPVIGFRPALASGCRAAGQGAVPPDGLGIAVMHAHRQYTPVSGRPSSGGAASQLRDVRSRPQMLTSFSDRCRHDGASARAASHEGNLSSSGPLSTSATFTVLTSRPTSGSALLRDTCVDRTGGGTQQARFLAGGCHSRRP